MKKTLTDYEIGMVDAGLTQCLECLEWFEDIDNNEICFDCLFKRR